MKNPAEVARILAILDELYPWDERCFLHYETDWQLLFATILSAQCTDARVNQVTPGLFQKYPTLQAFAAADVNILAEDVRSTGFYRTKAAHIIQSAQKLLAEHNGVMPSDIAALTALPGVGRKTANIIRGHIFHIDSVVVDTHVKRVTNKLGLSQHKDPEKIEYDLMAILPSTHWIRYNQQVITHGRAICVARRPKCGICALAGLCEGVI